MEVSDLRSINGSVCLAALERVDKCRYLGNNGAGGRRSSRVCASRSSAGSTGRACEPGSLSHLPPPRKLTVCSAGPSPSDPARGVAVGTFPDYLVPWHCNSPRRQQLGSRRCPTAVRQRSQGQPSAEANALAFPRSTQPTAMLINRVCVNLQPAHLTPARSPSRDPDGCWTPITSPREQFQP